MSCQSSSHPFILNGNYNDSNDGQIYNARSFTSLIAMEFWRMTGKIKLNAASGGGSVSFQAPSSTGDDRIITLPTTADGTVLTTTNPKAGNIIQVVSTTKTDTFTSNSTSYTDITGLSVSITPSSTSSKCFIQVNVHGIADASTQMYIQLFRTSDDSGICVGDSSGSRVQATLGSAYFHQSNDVDSQGINFLDSPNTTSAFNYKLRIRNQGSGTMYINRAVTDSNDVTAGRFASSITVMEVAG